jgi:hypothetical protein
MTTPNPLSYNGYVTALAVLAVTQTTTVPTDTTGTLHFVELNLDNLIPQALNYAELRIQRDLDLISLQTTKSQPYNTAPGNNVLVIPTTDILIVQNMQAAIGTKNVSLVPISKEWIQSVYNDSSVTGPPHYFAPLGGDDPTDGLTSMLFLVGPYPDLSDYDHRHDAGSFVEQIRRSAGCRHQYDFHFNLSAGFAADGEHDFHQRLPAQF